VVKDEVHGDDGELVESLSGLKGKPHCGTNKCAATKTPNQFVTKIVALHVDDHAKISQRQTTGSTGGPSSF
jgi:hypothetical protein